MRIYDFLKAYIGSTVAILASVCSVASFVLLFVRSEMATIVALSIFSLGWIVLVIGILKGINKVVNDNSEEEYKRIASFYTYKSEDGVKSTFEAFRMIQCKRLFLKSIPYNFKWTGAKVPNISSRAQSIEGISHVEDKNKWDSTVIKFPVPLKYNECAVINISTENDDVDGTARPWISSKLDTPIEMMVYRVMLSYKAADFSKPAFFERKRIDAEIDGDYVEIESVPYDKEHKMYYHTVVS